MQRLVDSELCKKTPSNRTPCDHLALQPVSEFQCNHSTDRRIRKRASKPMRCGVDGMVSTIGIAGAPVTTGAPVTPGVALETPLVLVVVIGMGAGTVLPGVVGIIGAV